MKLAYGAVIIAALIASLFSRPCHAQGATGPLVNLGAFAQRTQVGIGFQREWLTNAGAELATRKSQWVAVVPAAYNVTKSFDLVAQVGYAFGDKSTRVVLGVRAVIFGGS